MNQPNKPSTNPSEETLVPLGFVTHPNIPELAGAEVSGTAQRRIYTWNNQGTKYQVVWQSQDPNYLRVKVIADSGKTILNRLLHRQEECC